MFSEAAASVFYWLGIAVMFLLACAAFPLLHATGYVVASSLVRKPLLYLRVGRGREICHFRWGRRRIHLCLIPSEVAAVFCAANARYYRFRQWIIDVLPFTIVVGVTAAAFWGRFHFKGQISTEIGYLFRAVGILGIAFVVSGFFPDSTNASSPDSAPGQGRLSSLLPRFAKGQVALQVLLEQQNYAALLLGEGEHRRARRWNYGLFRRSVRGGFMDEALSFLMACDGKQLAPSAFDFIRNVIDERWVSVPTEKWAAAADILGTLALSAGKPELVAESLPLLRRAVEGFPEMHTYQGTLASLLFESGQIDEAVPMLDQVARESPNMYDQVIGSAYLVLFHARRNELELAAQWRARVPPMFLADALVEKIFSDPALKALPGVT